MSGEAEFEQTCLSHILHLRYSPLLKHGLGKAIKVSLDSNLISVILPPLVPD
jgi:hypothetical protein